MKSNYFFVNSLLPELHIGLRPELSFKELNILLMPNLSASDLGQIKAIRHFYDIENIRSLLKGKAISSFGYYNKKELEEALNTQTGLPEYVYDFMQSYPDIKTQLAKFSSLITTYFKIETAKANGRLKDFLNFERTWRLICVAFRCKTLGKDLGVELQYEDPSDLLVARLLAEKDAYIFTPPEPYENLKNLLEQNYHNPLQMHQALCEYRFNHISEMTQGSIFTFDRLLSYLLQVIIVEEWFGVSMQKGAAIIDTIIKESV